MERWECLETHRNVTPEPKAPFGDTLCDFLLRDPLDSRGERGHPNTMIPTTLANEDRDLDCAVVNSMCT